MIIKNTLSIIDYDGKKAHNKELYIVSFDSRDIVSLVYMKDDVSEASFYVHLSSLAKAIENAKDNTDW